MDPLASVDPGILAAFTAAALLTGVGAVLLGGFFPVAARPDAARGVLGTTLAWAGAVLTAALAVLSIGIALGHLPWAVAVVAAGAAFLAAPLFVQPLPARVRDTTLGLVIYLVLGGIVIVALPGAGII